MNYIQHNPLPIPDVGPSERLPVSMDTIFDWEYALLATAKIVQGVPWEEAKWYAANQVADEARHVEVYHRYLTEKLGRSFGVNRHLRTLLDQIICDSRWDMTYLGMQIIVEGLAL